MRTHRAEGALGILLAALACTPALATGSNEGSGALARVTSRVFDPLGRLAAIQGAAGQTTTLQYDANGRVSAIVDPLDQRISLDLDGLGRVTGTRFPDGAGATQQWSPLDQLVRVVDPKDVATGYTLNAFGEVVRETSPDIGAISYQRDAAGRVVEVRDARGQVSRIARDELGRPVRIELADGAITTFAYDAAGFVVEVQDASGSTTFSRDPQGRVLTKAQVVHDNPGAPSSFGVAYTLAPGGALAGLRYPGGLAVVYQRDATGRIVGIDARAPGGSLRAPPPVVPLLAGITYTALGQPRGWRWSNGDVAQRQFDTDARMTANEFASYTYDAAGRIRSLTQHLWTQSKGGKGASFAPTPWTWSVEYDSRNRITGFSRPGSEAQYTYDANGNRLSATRKRIRDQDADGTFSETEFARTEIQHAEIEAASNRLLGLSIVTTTSPHGDERPGETSGYNVPYTLDANGALTSDGERQFEYDAANRLAKLRLQSDGGTVNVRYLHNALGQRVFKGEPTADQASPDPATLGSGFVEWLKRQFGSLFLQTQASTVLGTAYVWGDGDIPAWALLGEYDNGSAGGKGRTEYIWLPLEDGSAIPVALFRGGRFYAVHTDHLGTPRLVTDDRKEPVWQWPYSAFGEVEPVGVLRDEAGSGKLKPAGPTVLDLRFPGQLHDDQLRANYNYFRDYDISTGRYRQVDPMGIEGGINPFTYASSDPLRRLDPFGLRDVIIAIWRPRVFDGVVGHAAALETDGRMLLSEFPIEKAARAPKMRLSWDKTVAAEGGDPEYVFRVYVPDDKSFDAEVARVQGLTIWHVLPDGVTSTHCAHAAASALTSGGVKGIRSNYLHPSELARDLLIQSLYGTKVTRLPHVPWKK